MNKRKILPKTKHEIAIMREGGKRLAQVILETEAAVLPGVSLLSLDKLAHNLMIKFDSIPAFLNYRPNGAKKPYPASICASINETIVHGVPNERIIKNGDILKLDFGLRYKGYCVDAAITVIVGKVSQEVSKLVEVTKESLYLAINEARSDKTLGDIGEAIYSHTKKYGLTVLEGLTGHGIGRLLHDDPEVLNYGTRGKGMQLFNGLTLAIEPMISLGSETIVQSADESYRTSDNSLSAHFEHTVLITNSDPIILTTL